MHYVVVSPHILQIAEIPTANTLTRNGQKNGQNGQKVPKMANNGRNDPKIAKKLKGFFKS